MTSTLPTPAAGARRHEAAGVPADVARDGDLGSALPAAALQLVADGHPARPAAAERPAATRSPADAEFLRRLGLTIRRIRRCRDWTQSELARAAGMSRNFLSEIERGHKGCEVVRLRWLAAALGVPPGVLLDAAADGPLPGLAVAMSARPVSQSTTGSDSDPRDEVTVW
jgi:DNA-binding XRE family transcriptional regulator